MKIRLSLTILLLFLSTLFFYSIGQDTTQVDTLKLKKTNAKGPTVNFSADIKSGCTGLTVQFSDKSVAGDAAINSWFWNFGDGLASNEKNPKHTYNKPGSYTVKLRVVDANKLSSIDLPFTNYIKISDTPSIQINPINAVCNPPKSVSFVNNSIVYHGTNPTYKWTFEDDGTTSTLKNPNHNYTKNGKWDVTFEITDDYNCKATKKFTDFVTVETISASFTISNDNICVGESTNFNATVNSSEPNPNYYIYWICNDGPFPISNTVGLNVSNTFNTRAINNVNLVVYNLTTGCQPPVNSILPKTLIVDKPVMGFSSIPNDFCKVPTNIQYTDTSKTFNPISTWKWTTNGSYVNSNQIIFNTTTSFNNPANTCVEVTTNKGCKNDTCKVIPFVRTKLQIDTVQSLTPKLKGCIPLDITIDTFPESLKLPYPTCNITKWEWVAYKKFKTFDQFYKSSLTPYIATISFTDTGTFNIRLILTTDCCGADTFELGDQKLIQPGTKPTVDFLLSDLDDNLITEMCMSDTLKVKDNSNIGWKKKKDEWMYHWNFGNGGWNHKIFPIDSAKIDFDDPNYSNGATSEIDSMEYNYYKDFGNKVRWRKPGLDSILYYSEFNECKSDTIFKTIDLNGPVIIIKRIFKDRQKPLEYYFSARVYDADTLKWYFGDKKDTSILADKSITNDSLHINYIRHKYTPNIYFKKFTKGNFFPTDTIIKPYKIKAYAINKSKSCKFTVFYKDQQGDTIKEWVTDTVKANLFLHNFKKKPNSDTIHADTASIFCYDELFYLNGDSSHYAKKIIFNIQNVSDPYMRRDTFIKFDSTKIKTLIAYDSINKKDTIYGAKKFIRHRFDTIVTNIQNIPFPVAKSNVSTFMKDSIMQRGNFKIKIIAISYSNIGWWKKEYDKQKDSLKPNLAYNDTSYYNKWNRSPKDTIYKNHLKILKPYSIFNISSTYKDWGCAKKTIFTVTPRPDPYAAYLPHAFKSAVKDTYFLKFGVIDTSFTYNDGKINLLYKDTTNIGYFIPQITVYDDSGCVSIQDYTLTNKFRHKFENNAWINDSIYLNRDFNQKRVIFKTDSILITWPKANFLIDTSFIKLCQGQEDSTRVNTINNLTNTNLYKGKYTHTSFNTGRLKYKWYWGDGDSVNYDNYVYQKDTTLTFQPKMHIYKDSAFNRPIKMITLDSIGCSDTTKIWVNIHRKPFSNFYALDTILACYPTEDTIMNTSTSIDSLDKTQPYIWWSGDAQPYAYSKTNAHVYTAPGRYNVRLSVMTEYGCVDTFMKEKYILVTGPNVKITIPDRSICLNEDALFELTTLTVDSIIWHFETDSIDGSTDYVPTQIAYKLDSVSSTKKELFSYRYNKSGNHFWWAYVKDTGNCWIYYPHQNDEGGKYYPPKPDKLSINVFPHKTDFFAADSACGVGDSVQWKDNSVAATQWNWKFEDHLNNYTSNLQNPVITYMFIHKGNEVWLESYDGNECYDTAIKHINVNIPPSIWATTDDTLICPDGRTIVHGPKDPHYIYTWSPAANFPNGNNTSDPTVQLATPTNVTISVVNDSSNCRSDATVFIDVQQLVKLQVGYINEKGDTIYTREGEIMTLPMGDTILPIAIPNQKVDTLYWLTSSKNGKGQIALYPDKDGKYEVRGLDTLKCKETSAFLDIDVLGTMDVPTAFTPNGDGINDYLKICGFGIKNIIDFKIYNRWGELLWQTQNIPFPINCNDPNNTGWDGTFKGKLQNVDTYVYTLTIELRDGNKISKNGSFTLMK